MLGGVHKDSEGQASSLPTEKGLKFDQTLFDAIEALENGKVSFAMIGGVAISGLGRPRSTQDIDIFVRAEDAEAALGYLEQAGFQTEKHDPSWLFKAFKNGVLVDLIFRSQPGIYFDAEMASRVNEVIYHGKKIRVVSPEDLVIIKCAVHTEVGAHHWHDALTILSHSQIDWDYLLHRSKLAPRRLLALLVYAQSNDILVPSMIIQNLFRCVFDDKSFPKAGLKENRTVIPMHPPHTEVKKEDRQPLSQSRVYVIGHLKEALAGTEQGGTLDLDFKVDGTKLLARGQCQSEQQYREVLKTISEIAPDFELVDQIRIVEWLPPSSSEVLS